MRFSGDEEGSKEMKERKSTYRWASRVYFSLGFFILLPSFRKILKLMDNKLMNS